MKDESAGLLAAAFIGIAPGYISRSVAGSYDNEAIAIFLLMFTFYLWIKALKLGSALYGTVAAVFYFYMVAAWGTLSFLPLHARLILTWCRWLCFHYEHDSRARSRLDPHGPLLEQALCRVLLVVRHWYSFQYAGAFRRLPACQH